MILSRLFAGDPTPSSHPPEDDFWWGPVDTATKSGVRVDADSAMRISAVFGCIRIISETLASLPNIVYKRLADDGKERARDHWAYSLLRYRPNPWQTAVEFYEMMTAHCALRGNAFAEIVWTGAGVVDRLVPLHPDRVKIDYLENGRMRYRYRDPLTGQERPLLQDDVFHLRGLSMDGRVGLSVIGYQRETVGLTMAANDYGARFFMNDATPRIVLTHPDHFKDKPARDRFRASFNENVTGQNRHGTAILEDGIKIEKMGVSNEDAQFLETRRYQVADIARIFRVPLVLLQETEKSTSWGTGIEQFMLAFVIHCIRPWAIRWEQSLQRHFLTDGEGDDPGENFCEFLMDALLRGDLKSRYDAYKIGIDAGFLVPNEARRFENMNPIDGGDEIRKPQAPAAPGAPPANQDEKPKTPAPADDDVEEDARVAGNLVRAEVNAATGAWRQALDRSQPRHFDVWIDRFYSIHRVNLVSELGLSPASAKRYCEQHADAIAAARNTGTEALQDLLTAWAQNGADYLLELKKGQGNEA